MIAKEKLTGIVLAGGKSSRMGTDKGFISWKGKPFINHSMDALKLLVNNIFIVSDHKQYENLGYKRIEDVLPERGPLSGLYSGLLKSNTQLSIVLSCDVPLITSEIVEKLISNYTDGTNAVVCKVGNQVMPLVALYSKNCMDRCQELLKNDKRSMMGLLEKLDRVIFVPLNQEQAKQVKNINSSKDLNDIKNAS